MIVSDLLIMISIVKSNKDTDQLMLDGFRHRKHSERNQQLNWVYVYRDTDHCNAMLRTSPGPEYGNALMIRPHTHLPKVEAETAKEAVNQMKLGLDGESYYVFNWYFVSYSGRH